MMENFVVIVFSSIVCDVILQEQMDKHLNETHQLPCLKRKLVHSAWLYIQFADEKQIRQTHRMKLFIVTYQGGVVLAIKALDSGRIFSKKEGMMWIAYGPNGG